LNEKTNIINGQLTNPTINDGIADSINIEDFELLNYKSNSTIKAIMK